MYSSPNLNKQPGWPWFETWHSRDVTVMTRPNNVKSQIVWLSVTETVSCLYCLTGSALKMISHGGGHPVFNGSMICIRSISVIFNSLAPEKYKNELTNVFVKLNLRIDILSTSCEISLLLSVTAPHWWFVNIGSGNGLVPSGTKPLP